ncbi:hypothetical protein [Undibacterium sp. RuTC16W]
MKLIRLFTKVLFIASPATSGKAFATARAHMPASATQIIPGKGLSP